MAATENALAAILSPSTLAKELEGFSFIPSDGVPFITLDKQRRFYFNSSTRKMFGLRAYSQIAIGYNSDTRSLAVVTKNADRLPPNFIYMLDKRCYASARRFVSEYRIDVSEEPLTYMFERSTSVDGVYIFRLDERD